ncbi:MAG TPA: ABC transporter permease [Vicinamibacterales bacterium]|nr:ABC transporter permease [Vicinamibacterales bacterium]
MRLLRYAFDEAAASLWRGRQSSLLSTATIALALFVLGAFLVVTSNLERLAEEWSGAAELSIYLVDDIDGPDRAAIERAVSADPAVAGVEFVTKDAALARFKHTFPDLAQTLSAMDENPLPASLDVRLRPSSSAQASVDALVDRMRSTTGVSDVRYDKAWLDRLLRGVRLLRLVGFALGGALIVAAALTITNVVRLALNARRDELDIMQLVGAPQSYVRGPFVMEGALHGGVGSLAALLVLAIAFFAARGRFLLPLASALNLSSVQFLSPLLTLALLGGGVVVGCLAGVVASRRA